jgi:hypothetical protein
MRSISLFLRSVFARWTALVARFKAPLATLSDEAASDDEPTVVYRYDDLNRRIHECDEG